MCIMLMSTWFICATLLIDGTATVKLTWKTEHGRLLCRAKYEQVSSSKKYGVEEWNVEQTHYEALCGAWINTFVSKTRCPFSSPFSWKPTLGQGAKFPKYLAGLQKVIRSPPFKSPQLKIASSWISVLVLRVLTLKGWGVDPRPFCGEFRPDMEARVPLTLEAGGRQRHVCGSPAKGNVVQIYKYTNTNTQIQIGYGWQGCHWHMKPTHRGGTSAPCMWFLCKRQHCLNNRTKSSPAVAEAGKVFMWSFKSKDAVLDDMFTFAVMQTSFGKRLKLLCLY